MTYSFSKEDTLPTTNRSSPFYSNLPPNNTKPIDDLVFHFKCWKKFIKSLIYYFKEIVIAKEFTAKINFQLINSVLFPGAMNLPKKYMADIGLSQPLTTPPKELKKTFRGSLSTMHANHSASDLTSTPSGGAGHTAVGGSSTSLARPNLFKTKSNQSFLKPKNKEVMVLPHGTARFSPCLKVRRGIIGIYR